MKTLTKRSIRINSSIYAWGRGGMPMDIVDFEDVLYEMFEEFGWKKKPNTGGGGNLGTSLTLVCGEDGINSEIYLHPMEVCVTCSEEMWNDISFIFEEDTWYSQRFGEVSSINVVNTIEDLDDNEQLEYLKSIEAELIAAIENYNDKSKKRYLSIEKQLLGKRKNIPYNIMEPVYDKKSKTYKYIQSLIDKYVVA